MEKETKRRKLTAIVVFLLGAFLLTNEITFIQEDNNFDLAKASNISGVVQDARMREIMSHGIKYETFKDVFYFKLVNSSEKFAVFRFDGAYNDLLQNVRIGDTVKVYYHTTSNDYNQNVFQVERNGKVIQSYEDYKHDLSASEGIGLFIGVIFLISSIMYYKQISIIKLLTSWVEK